MMFDIFRRHPKETPEIVRARQAARESAHGVSEAEAVKEDAAQDRYSLTEMRRKDHIGTHLFGKEA